MRLRGDARDDDADARERSAIATLICYSLFRFVADADLHFIIIFCHYAMAFIYVR